MVTNNSVNNVPVITTTQHSVLIGGASNTISSLGVATTGTVLAGVTGADPAFTATPSVTSITLGGGSALGTYVGATSFTPTLTGAATAGTTTYNAQVGFYIRIGDLVVCMINLNVASATGTGNLTIGNLPFTINGNGNFASPGAAVTNYTLPVGTTYCSSFGNANTKTAILVAGGSAAGLAVVQMENAARSVYTTFIYSV